MISIMNILPKTYFTAPQPPDLPDLLPSDLSLTKVQWTVTFIIITSTGRIVGLHYYCTSYISQSVTFECLTFKENRKPNDWSNSHLISSKEKPQLRSAVLSRTQSKKMNIIHI